MASQYDSDEDNNTADYSVLSPLQEAPTVNNYNCKKCGQRPRNPPHEYCSRECGAQCELPGCSKSKFYSRGATSKYCSHEHRKESVTRGLETPCALCGEFPQAPDSIYCGAACTTRANSAPPSVFRPAPEPLSPTIPISPQISEPTSVSSHMLGLTLSPSSVPPTPLSPKPASSPRSSVMDPASLIPRNPPANLRPRSAFMVEFGEYNGDPNFLIRTGKGINWTNAPPALNTVLEEKRKSPTDILDFTLGSAGRFYIAYKDGHDVRVKTSPGLWGELNEDFHRGGLRQLEFGADDTVFGIKAWRDYSQSNRQSMSLGGGLRNQSDGSGPGTDYVVMEEPFGSIPDSLFEKAVELEPTIQHYDEVNFVAVGHQGSWVMGVSGQYLFWDKIEAGVIRHLTKMWQEFGTIRNVELSPCTGDIYFIEPEQGKVAYHVPDHWHPWIRRYFNDEHRLAFDNSSPNLAKPARPRAGHVSPGAGPRRPGPGTGPNHQSRPNSSPGPHPGPSHHNSYFRGGAPGAPAYRPPAQPSGQRGLSQYGDRTRTSGMIQAGQKSGHAGMSILKEVVKVAPAVITAGVHLAPMLAAGAACVVM